MATTTVDIGTLITRREGVKGGRPIIAGTGTSVEAIVGWYLQGMSPAEIQEQFPALALEGIFAALTYYTANRDEIEGYCRDHEAAEREWMADEARRRGAP